MLTTIHYAVQTCDVASNQNIERYCNCSKTELVEKCITSFFESVTDAANHIPTSLHKIMIFDDCSTDQTLAFLEQAKQYYARDNISIEITNLNCKGVMPSIKACYEWLKNNGEQLVYQVQDDYLFQPSAIFEMMDLINQLNRDVETHAVVMPFNDPMLWQGTYRYASTSRTIIPGLARYWIQMYDASCSFMTTKEQFSAQWDLYEMFFSLGPLNPKLEPLSINKMFVDRGVLGAAPAESLALHIQGNLDKDQYIDWQARWNAVPKLSVVDKSIFTSDKKIVLNLGAGWTPLVEFTDFFNDYKEIRVDVLPECADIVTSLVDLAQVPDESVDAVWACHVIEHMYWHDLPGVFSSIIRVLKKEGFAVIRVPSLSSIAAQIETGLLESAYMCGKRNHISICPIDIIYGARFTHEEATTPEFKVAMLHKTGFTSQSMSAILKSLGINAMVQDKSFEVVTILYKDVQPTYNDVLMYF